MAAQHLTALRAAARSAPAAKTTALCARPPVADRDQTLFTLTEAREMMQNIARTILRRFSRW